jgi:hypothetical protein
VSPQVELLDTESPRARVWICWRGGRAGTGADLIDAGAGRLILGLRGGRGGTTFTGFWSGGEDACAVVAAAKDDGAPKSGGGGTRNGFLLPTVALELSVRCLIGEFDGLGVSRKGSML